MNENKKYNGWTNFQTWYIYTMCGEWIEEQKDNMKEEEIKEELENLLFESLDGIENKNMKTMLKDMVGYFLEDVNFREISKVVKDE